jgi:hypothetical protein
MIITASPHKALSHHLVATGADRMRHGAPQALYTAVAALTGLAEIRGLSVVRMTSDELA